MGKMQIYGFINSGSGTDWVVSMAMAADGTCCAQHVSSSDAWARNDIGAGNTGFHHDDYDRLYPDGWEIEWVDDVKAHEGLMEAYRLNQEKDD